MPIKSLSEITRGLFPELPHDLPESGTRSETRQTGRAAVWRANLARSYAYAHSRARGEQEADELTAAYEAELARGPDFTRYRRGSDFRPAPKLSIDRNLAARIKFKLQAIRRGSWQAKEKGKHAGDIQHSVIEVFDALVRLALKHGQVYPSLVGLGYLATRSKQTVVNALKVLEFYGFITVHRRIKRVRTPLGIKTVQDTNAYAIHEPNAWGRLSYAVFMGERSESKNQSARKSESFTIKEDREFSGLTMPWEGWWSDLKAEWEAN